MSSAPWLMQTAFSAADRLSLAGAWMQSEAERYAGGDVSSALDLLRLDGQGLMLAALAIFATFVIFAKQAARWAAVATSGGKTITRVEQIPDTPLLRMLQSQWLGLLLVYAHCCHRDAMDALAADPAVLVLAAAVLLHLVCTRAFLRDGLLPPRTRIVLLRLWRKWVFIFPADPAVIVWSLVGYALPRFLFPATTGSGQRAWIGSNFDPFSWQQNAASSGLAAIDSSREDRAGIELCSYAWQIRAGQLGSEAAMRSCADISLILLLCSGIARPVVQFGREAVEGCSRLHSKYTTLKTVATPSDTKQQKQQRTKAASAPAAVAAAAAPSCAESDCDECDDDEHNPSSPQSLSLHMRFFPALHMLLLCSLAAWITLAGSVVWARGGGWSSSSASDAAAAGGNMPVLEPAESACPVPRLAGGIAGAYEREEFLLRSNGASAPAGSANAQIGCAAQWNQMHQSFLVLSSVVGILCAVSLHTLRVLPLQLRLPLFVSLCLAVWKGSILPACTVVASRCLA